MRGVRTTPTRAIGLLAVSLLAGTSVGAGVVEVPVEIPIPPRIDMRGMNSILVARFYTDNTSEIDVVNEVIRFLRIELDKKTSLQVLDLPLPPLPEQDFETLLRNDAFWRKLGTETGADLILSGQVLYGIADRSGFVEDTYISELTGQRVRSSRYAQRTEFALTLDIAYLRGPTGKLLFRDDFLQTRLVEGNHDGLQVLYELFERASQDVIGTLVGRARTEMRYLFTEL